MWFAVHVLTGYSDAQANSDEVVVEESVHLIESKTQADAEQLGELIAEKYAQSTVSYLDPRPSKIENLGVRRVVTISNPDLGADAPPQHETEINYEVMKFASRADLEAYRRGVSIKATFWEKQE